MTKVQRLPLQVWILTLSAFAIGTAEFIIAGILTQVADTLRISEGQAGNLITAYALAIVIGGPVLTLWLARYSRKKVLVGLMVLFVAANVVSSVAHTYELLMVSRVVAGLVQGPFYGIGAVVATRLVPKEMAGQAVGQMFAGLTLANVLGVPGGAWIGAAYGWNEAFVAVALFGLLALLAIGFFIPNQPREKTSSVASQIGAFANTNLLASLLITVLAWTGFMCFYGYIAPVAEQVAGFSRDALAWILVVVGIGLVIGNHFGGKSSDRNLRLSLMGWPIAMVIVLGVVGFVSHSPVGLVLGGFIFGVVSFANVPPMQMRVMKYAGKAPELAATANISAFNVANALGGFIGGMTIDHVAHGVSLIPFVAMIVPAIGILFILWQEKRTPSDR